MKKFIKIIKKYNTNFIQQKIKKLKTKSSKEWLIKKNKDIFIKEAKKKGYRSRAAFKLLQINEKYNFLNKSNIILELGSSPGMKINFYL
jgi:23S rRNA (uridine2552-2'-O)-methyltransferase